MDRRKAIRMAYTGRVASPLYSDPKTSRTYPIKYVELMISSKDVTHFLNLMAEPEQFDRHLGTFEDVVRSFRSFGGR